MNWQCNYCGHRTQPIKEVKEVGDDWPAGRGCWECGKGEFIRRPKKIEMTITIEQLKNLIMKYDYENGSYPESEYEGLSVYSFVCKELGIEYDLKDYDVFPDQKYAKFLKKTFEKNQ